MLVLVYRKCSTCQKALKWLEEHKIFFEERAIVEENPTYEELKEWYERSGMPLKKFFNTSAYPAIFTSPDTDFLLCCHAHSAKILFPSFMRFTAAFTSRSILLPHSQ